MRKSHGMHAAFGKVSRAHAVLMPQVPAPEQAIRVSSAKHLIFWRATQVRVDVFISFGGLLMQLTGDPSKLEDLHVDAQVYLLMRKV